MKTIFLIYCLTLSAFLSAQDILSDSVILKRGFYKNLKELRDNNPSIPFNQKIKVYQTSFDSIPKVSSIKTADGLNVSWLNDAMADYKLFKGTNSIPQVYIEYHPKTPPPPKEKVVGFCDGRTVYVTKKKITPSYYTKFHPLQNIGLYCYFETVGNCGTKKCLKPKVLELKNLQILDLDEEFILFLINQNPEAYRDFQNDSTTHGHFKNYIIHYSSQYQDSIPQLSHDGNENILDPNSNLDSLIQIQSNENIESYQERLKSYKADSLITSIDFEIVAYSNGQIKSRGVKAKHLMSEFPDLYWKIGTWFYYRKDGTLEKTIDYSLDQRKMKVTHLN